MCRNMQTIKKNSAKSNHARSWENKQRILVTLPYISKCYTDRHVRQKMKIHEEDLPQWGISINIL